MRLVEFIVVAAGGGHNYRYLLVAANFWLLTSVGVWTVDGLAQLIQRPRAALAPTLDFDFISAPSNHNLAAAFTNFSVLNLKSIVEAGFVSIVWTSPQSISNVNYVVNDSFTII